MRVATRAWHTFRMRADAFGHPKRPDLQQSAWRFAHLPRRFGGEPRVSAARGPGSGNRRGLFLPELVGRDGGPEPRPRSRRARARLELRPRSRRARARLELRPRRRGEAKREQQSDWSRLATSHGGATTDRLENIARACALSARSSTWLRPASRSFRFEEGRSRYLPCRFGGEPREARLEGLAREIGAVFLLEK